MKSRKEKILIVLIVISLIATFVVGWLWGLASANGENQDAYAVLAITLLIAFLALKNYHHQVITERRIQETVDKVMDAIIEFRKETIKETETKVLKKLNKK